MYNIADEVKRVIAQNREIKEDILTGDTSFSNDLNLDSLDMIELVMVFEREFNLTIPDEKVAGLKTVAHVVEYIEQAVSTRTMSEFVCV